MRIVLALLGVSVGLMPAARAGATRTFTVEQVVEKVLRENPRLGAVRAHAASSHARAAGSRGSLLPSIRVNDEYDHYDGPFEVAFTIPGDPTAFPPVLAREANTNTFSAVASQPILGLLHRSQQYLADSKRAQAADAGVLAARLNTREAVEVEYLRYFEARALEEVAKASQAQLDEEVASTEAKLRAGTMTNADLLRVRVAAGNARQQVIAAHTQGVAARAVILSAMGMAADATGIEFAEPTSLLDRPVGAAHELASALRLRPEMIQLRLTASAADHQRRARAFQLLPEVDAVGGYLRSDGQVFLPENQAFVGLRASWSWTWGADWYAQRAAGHDAEAASLDVKAQELDIGVELATRQTQLDAAISAVALARRTVESAEEAFRVTSELLRAGAATTTDLLDSQAALTQSRAQLARARYEEAIAHVSLEHAAGR